MTHAFTQIEIGNGHGIFFPLATVGFDPFPDGGGYPLRFLEWAAREVGIEDRTQVLHVCSGSVREGFTVDVRVECRPRVCADGRRLPFADETFRWALADPPYTEDYARSLYGTASTFPHASELLRELSRVLKPGGRCGILHYFVPFPQPGLALVRVCAVSFGCGYGIRAFTIFERVAQQFSLFGEP